MRRERHLYDKKPRTDPEIRAWPYFVPYVIAIKHAGVLFFHDVGWSAVDTVHSGLRAIRSWDGSDT